MDLTVEKQINDMLESLEDCHTSFEKFIEKNQTYISATKEIELINKVFYSSAESYTLPPFSSFDPKGDPEAYPELVNELFYPSGYRVTMDFFLFQTTSKTIDNMQGPSVLGNMMIRIYNTQKMSRNPGEEEPVLKVSEGLMKICRTFYWICRSSSDLQDAIEELRKGKVVQKHVAFKDEVGVVSDDNSFKTPVRKNKNNKVVSDENPPDVVGKKKMRVV